MSPRFLVTCAHVVNTALGLPAGAEEHPGERARVRLAQSHSPVWEASVGTEVWSAGHGEIDVAVLWLTSAGFPDTGHPVRVAGSRLRQGEPLRTTGYPDGFALHSSLLYLGPAGPSRASHQATLPENEVQPITEGFSGCAAITGSGELVGIVQQNHFHAHDGDRPSGTAFILTTDDMPDGHHVGRRDHRSGTGPVPRLTDEALCRGRLRAPARLPGRSRRPVPSAGRWLREEAHERLGDGWEQELDSELARRLWAQASSPEVSAAGEGNDLFGLGRIQEALDQDTTALATCEAGLGPHHLFTLIARRNQLISRRALGEEVGAEWSELRSEFVAGYGPDHLTCGGWTSSSGSTRTSYRSPGDTLRGSPPAGGPTPRTGHRAPRPRGSGNRGRVHRRC